MNGHPGKLFVVHQLHEMNGLGVGDGPRVAQVGQEAVGRAEEAPPPFQADVRPVAGQHRLRRLHQGPLRRRPQSNVAGKARPLGLRHSFIAPPEFGWSDRIGAGNVTDLVIGGAIGFASFRFAPPVLSNSDLPMQNRAISIVGYMKGFAVTPHSFVSSSWTLPRCEAPKKTKYTKLHILIELYRVSKS